MFFFTRAPRVLSYHRIKYHFPTFVCSLSILNVQEVFSKYNHYIIMDKTSWKCCNSVLGDKVWMAGELVGLPNVRFSYCYLKNKDKLSINSARSSKKEIL